MRAMTNSIVLDMGAGGDWHGPRCVLCERPWNAGVGVVVAPAAAGVDAGVDVGGIAGAAKSAGVACAVFVSGVPVAVAEGA